MEKNLFFLFAQRKWQQQHQKLFSPYSLEGNCITLWRSICCKQKRCFREHGRCCVSKSMERAKNVDRWKVFMSIICVLLLSKPEISKAIAIAALAPKKANDGNLLYL